MLFIVFRVCFNLLVERNGKYVSEFLHDWICIDLKKKSQKDILRCATSVLKPFVQRVIAIITHVTQTLAHGILVGSPISDTHSLEMGFPKGGSAIPVLGITTKKSTLNVNFMFNTKGLILFMPPN